jgi:hypothetical protein
MRRVDQTAAPCTNASRHTNSDYGLMLMTLPASMLFKIFLEAPGDLMKVPLQNHAPVGYVSFLVSKTPPKSRRKWTGTMVSSSLMCDQTLQHSLPISCVNTIGSRHITKLTHSTDVLPPRCPNWEENTMISSYLDERPLKQNAHLHSARHFIMPFARSRNKR